MTSATAPVVSSSPAGDVRVRWGLVIAVCVGVASGSLLWQATPGFDPWVWSLWGRDLARLQLDTSMVVSFKPLPVVVIALFELVGISGPVGWLVVARTGGLLALVAAWRHADRAAGPWAGAVAAAALLLGPAVDGRFARLTIQGSAEPLVAALCLLALEAHLRRRSGLAIALLAAASLARPEVWAFLLLYAAWRWREQPGLRPWLVVVTVAVPVVWLGGDWLGSGHPLTGAERAQVVGPWAARVEEVVFATSRTVAVPVWGAAGVGVWAAWRRRHGVLLVLAGAAAAWIVAVAMLSLLFGYAALGRFLLPATAALSVLAGVGAVQLVRLPAARVARVAVTVTLVAATLPSAVALGRLALGPEGVALTTTRATLDRDVDRLLAAAGGREAVLGCGAVGVGRGPHFGFLWPALAWKLGLPLADVERPLESPRGVSLLLAEQATPARPEGGGVHELARTELWVAHAVGCRPPG